MRACVYVCACVCVCLRACKLVRACARARAGGCCSILAAAVAARQLLVDGGTYVWGGSEAHTMQVMAAPLPVPHPLPTAAARSMPGHTPHCVRKQTNHPSRSTRFYCQRWKCFGGRGDPRALPLAPGAFWAPLLSPLAPCFVWAWRCSMATRLGKKGEAVGRSGRSAVLSGEGRRRE